MELDNRMISAEWLKTRCYEICDEYNTNHVYIDRLIDEIDNAPDVEVKIGKTPGVAVQKWIPVSERLPENGEISLCRLTFDELRILQWDDVSKWWLGYGVGDDWRQKDVSHWMPLPEAPKEEK